MKIENNVIVEFNSADKNLFIPKNVVGVDCLLARPTAMEYWALQYVKSVEVIAPKSLREKIKGTLKNSAKQYD